LVAVATRFRGKVIHADREKFDHVIIFASETV